MFETWRYSDMAPLPSRSASRAMDSAPSPSALANSIAVVTMRSESAPATFAWCVFAPRGSSARGSGASSSDRLAISHQTNHARLLRTVYADRDMQRRDRTTWLAAGSGSLSLGSSSAPFRRNSPAIPSLEGSCHVRAALSAVGRPCRFRTVSRWLPPWRRSGRDCGAVTGLHRRAGRIYVAAAFPAARARWRLAPPRRSGQFSQRATSSSPRCGCGSPSMATSPSSRRRYAEHRRHMLRSATLALSIITNRIWTPSYHRLATIAGQRLWRRRAALHLAGGGPGSWLGWTIRCSRCSGG